MKNQVSKKKKSARIILIVNNLLKYSYFTSSFFFLPKKVPFFFRQAIYFTSCFGKNGGKQKCVSQIDENGLINQWKWRTCPRFFRKRQNKENEGTRGPQFPLKACPFALLRGPHSNCGPAGSDASLAHISVVWVGWSLNRSHRVFLPSCTLDA